MGDEENQKLTPIERKAQKVREQRKTEKREKEELQKFLLQIERLDNTEQSILAGFNALIEFLDQKTTKTEVVNQIEEVATPDIKKILIPAIDKLVDAQEKVDTESLKKVLEDIGEKLDKLPTSFPDPIKAPEEVSVKNLSELDKRMKIISDGLSGLKNEISKLELKAEPQVNVESPTINVEPPDLDEIKLGLTNVIDAIKFAKPEIPETDFTGIEEILRKHGEELERIRKKPVPQPPSVDGVIDAFSDGTQKTQIVDAGGEAATVTDNKLDVNATFSGTVESAPTFAQNPGDATPTPAYGLIDSDFHPQVDVLSSALPTGAATAANQQTDALTDAELRATPVPVTSTPSGTQNVDVTANTIGLATSANQVHKFAADRTGATVVNKQAQGQTADFTLHPVTATKTLKGIITITARNPSQTTAGIIQILDGSSGTIIASMTIGQRGSTLNTNEPYVDQTYGSDAYPLIFTSSVYIDITNSPVVDVHLVGIEEA